MSDENVTPGARIEPECGPGYTFDPEALWDAYSFTNPRLAFTLGLTMDLSAEPRCLRLLGGTR